GRGFLGFDRIVRTDEATGEIVETTYDNSTKERSHYPYAGFPATITTVVKLDSGVTHARLEEQTYKTFWPGGPYLDTYRIQNTKTRTREYEIPNGPSPQDLANYEYSPGSFSAAVWLGLNAKPQRTASVYRLYDSFNNVVEEDSIVEGGSSKYTYREFDN